VRRYKNGEMKREGLYSNSELEVCEAAQATTIGAADHIQVNAAVRNSLAADLDRFAKRPQRRYRGDKDRLQ
jgi:hypothetical protein